MKLLYGKDVFPDAVVALWNNGLGHMEHMLADTVALQPEDETARAAATLLA